VSGLAYYLGAEVVPARSPRIVTDSGFEYPLDDGEDYERRVARILRQVVFLEILTRNGGLYDFKLHEREALRGELGLEFDPLYDQPPGARLPSYLSVDWDAIEPNVPDWELTRFVTISQFPVALEV